MADNRILIEVELDQAQAQKRAIALTAEIARQRKELAKYRKQLKDSNGTNKEAAAQVEFLSRQIKENSKELRLNQRELSATENSTEALRVETSKLQQAQNKLDTSTEEGRKEFARLEEQLKANREQLNENSKAAGSFKDNIGNYTASIQEAIGLNSEFTQGLAGFQSAIQGTTGVVNILRVALASLGILAVVTALSAFFTQTRTGRQLVERFGNITRAVFAQIGVITERVFGNIGEFFKDFKQGIQDFWNNPLETAKDAAKSLGDAIVENLTNRLQGFLSGVKVVSEAVKLLFEGEFSKAIDKSKELGTAFVQTFTGASKDAIDGFSDSLTNLIAQADRLTKRNISLRASIRRLREEASLQQRDAEIARKQRDDEFKSLTERLALNDKVLEAERARRDALLELNKAQQQIIRNEIAISGGQATEAQLDELSQLRAEALEIQEDFEGRTTEQLTEANAIRREELQAQANLEKAILEEKLITQQLTEEEALQQRLAVLDKERQAALVGLKEGSVEREQVIQEFRNRELELRKEFNEKLQEQNAEAQAKQLDALKLQLDAEVKAQADAEKRKQAQIKATDAVKKASLANAKAVTDSIISLFGEESKAGKAAFFLQKSIAIAEAIVNGQAAISRIQRAFPGPIGIPFTIAQVASTAGQVATIAAQQIGGTAGGSASVPNTSGISSGNISAPSTSVVSSSPSFAGGGSTAFQSGQRTSGALATKQLSQDISKLQVQVAVTDIAKAQNRYNQVQARVNG